MARVQLNHCDELEIVEGSISDAKLIQINEMRKQVFDACEFGEALPLVLNKAHLVTWCFGELPITGNNKEFSRLKASLQRAPVRMMWRNS